jgi:aminoglycoside 6'-N-acetyltransferase
VGTWWGFAEDHFPFEDSEVTRFSILVDGAVAGLIQYYEETDPSYRHASIDLYVDPRHHRRGVATFAIRAVIAELRARGHHRITIDPAADNHAAIACYERAGFRRVGVMRAHWRDVTSGAWRDGMLMELVESPNVPPSPH